MKELRLRGKFLAGFVLVWTQDETGVTAFSLQGDIRK